MSLTQTIARNLLSDRLYESLRAESQSWVMRCPCGAQTSIWEMGGIRWKAAGQPRRMGHCGTCRRQFWGEVYQSTADVAGLTADQTQRNVMHTPHAPIELSQTAAILLWIDGVGCWMVFPGGQLTVGGPVEPGSSQAVADLCVLANLRRVHATIERSGESYRLTSVDAGEPTWLQDGSDIDLGGRLTMRFRVPSVLSRTAVLAPAGEPWPRMFTAGRTPASVDGIVLLDEVCLLGAGSDAHVPCRDWEQTVILFRRQGQLWCRSQGELEINGEPVTTGRPLSDGAVVGSAGRRFRVEAVPKAAA